MSDPRHNQREIRPPTGPELTARSWLIEAPMRMLMNDGKTDSGDTLLWPGVVAMLKYAFTEEQKGNDTIREAAATLRPMTLPGEFQGFIEGNDIPSGSVDVVVTDGFTGNIALKTAEGTAQLYSSFLRNTFAASLMARLGYLLARPAFLKLKKRTDPRRYNGGVFLGLRGICVKSHGGTDAVGFSNAVGVAYDLLKENCNPKIEAGISELPAELLKGNGGAASSEAEEAAQPETDKAAATDLAGS